MLVLEAVFKTARTEAWGNSLQTGRVLHVFENSCNLVDLAGSVLSLVNPGLGCGPFNLVLAAPISFQADVTELTAVAKSGEGFSLGDWQIKTTGAQCWEPRPDWTALRSAGIPRLRTVLEESARSSAVQPGIVVPAIPDLSDPAALRQFSGILAGRGPGLTPSGDDFLMGWMHALWLRLPERDASRLCAAIAGESIPRTTTLSGAWLAAARDGEAGEPWHAMFTALIQNDEAGVIHAARAILATGHTSGADALAGFLAGLK